MPPIRQTILFACLLFTLSTHAQYKLTNPTHLTKKEGLPDNHVYAIEQDKDGFLWFATMEGLCRYDGSVAKVLQHAPGDAATLSHNTVTRLMYDGKNNELWIGTHNGLNVLDLRTEQFRSYFYDPDDAHSLPGNNIFGGIFKDRQGVIWIGTKRSGIARFNPAEDNFDRYAFPISGEEKGELVHTINHIRAIRQDVKNDSILWIAGKSGLLKFNTYDQKFTRYYFDVPEKGIKISINTNNTLYQSPDGRIFLGSWYGLNIFDPETESFHNVRPTLDVVNYALGAIASEVVLSILKKSEQELWITTRAGLTVYDIAQNLVCSEWINDPKSNTFYGVHYQDKGHRLWATSAKGVYGYDPLKEQFEHYAFGEIPRPLYPMKVVEAPGGDKLFVSVTGGQGLYRLDRKTGKWNVIPPPKPFFKTYRNFAGRDLIFLQDGRLLQVEESTLFTLSPDGTQLVPFPLQPGQRDARFMWALQDHHGSLWVTSVNGGLFKLSLETGEVQQFQKELEGATSAGKNAITVGSMVEGRYGNIWIKASRGFSLYLSQRDTFLNFRYQAGKNNVFIDVSGFIEDGEGNMLIGGGGGMEDGIGVADLRSPEKGILRRLEFPGKAPFFPALLTKDKRGNLWMLDKGKLNKINLPGRSMESYDGFDGLIYSEDDPEFINFNSLDLLSTGEIAISYAGGKGIGVFHPDSLKNNLERPKPYLTSFSVFDKALVVDTALFYLQEITLPYSQNFFSFEFSSIGFTQGFKSQYKYKLEGLDPDWIYPSRGRRYASYSNVREGYYILSLMAANNDGLWNDEPLQFHIHILPPWFRTGWAYLSYLALLLTVGFSIYRFLKQRWMLKMKLAMEHKEALRLKELDAAKTRLYTNITHEFRTPLTIILGMADELRSQANQQAQEGLQMIKRNGQNLLQLVNQMLDLRKLESGSMPVKMIQGDIIAYLKYILESFHSLAASKNIRLHFESQPGELLMDYDPEKALNIVSNLLSNAVKFTPEGGRVEVRVDRCELPVDRWPETDSQHPHKEATKAYAIRAEQKAGSFLAITVADTGIGIPPEDLSRIFGRFYQAPTGLGGVGIGLALTKELVKLLKGGIAVKSKLGEGTEFRITLPIANTATRQGATAVPFIQERVEAYAPSAASKTSLSKRKRPLVLVIEDNRDVVRYLNTCLQDSYQLNVTYNGGNGILKAFETVPDIIISDVMMPEKDGFEVCRTLKTDLRTSHIPIILLTAKADIESRLEGLEQGADAYLAKPFNKSELSIRIRKLLELRKKMQIRYLALDGLKGGAAATAPSFAKKLESEFVVKIRGLVESNLTDYQFGIDTLCLEAGMSRSQLHRKLTALTGYSANQFIRFVRLSKAKRLLQDPRLSVAEVGYDTGFNDPVYFSRVFRKEFGVTPTEYRKMRPS